MKYLTPMANQLWCRYNLFLIDFLALFLLSLSTLTYFRCFFFCYKPLSLFSLFSLFSLSLSLLSLSVSLLSSLFSQGDVGHTFFVIKEGEAVITINENTPTERELTHIYIGQYFGETALIYGSKRTATVRSVGRCVCGVLSQDKFETLTQVRGFLLLQKYVTTMTTMTPPPPTTPGLTFFLFLFSSFPLSFSNHTTDVILYNSSQDQNNYRF